MTASTLLSALLLTQAIPTAVGPEDFARPLKRIPTDEVVINEIMYHPPNGAFLEEFIELHNTAGYDVLIGGASFSDGIGFSFPAGYVLPAGGFVVVAADVPTFQAKYPGVSGVLGPWTGKLTNRGENLRLDDANGNQLDEVFFADQGTWADRREGPVSFNHTGWVWVTDHDGAGSSAELINPGLSNKRGHNWAASSVVGGTPGAANSTASTNGAPLLSKLDHDPVIPTSSDAVTVTVRVEDEDPENLDVDLFYRHIFSTGSFTQVSMNDSGNNGDELADDGVYAGQIPPGNDGQGFEFYVRAEDGDAQVRTHPGPVNESGLQRANAIYQIDNALAASLPLAPDDEPMVRLIFNNAENVELHSLPGSADKQSKAQFNATLITLYPGDTDVRYNCGVRIRGNSSLNANPPQYRCNIPHDDPWGDRVEINFNNQYPHSQVFGSVAYRWAGIPAAVSYFVLMRINNEDLTSTGEPNMGHYNYLQQTNSQVAQQQFPLTPDLNIYRGDRGESGGKADLSWEGPDPIEYKDGYFKRTNEEADDYSDLIALIDALNNSPEATFFKDVNAVADLDQWALFFAWDRLMGNREGSIGNGNGDDYHLSFDPVSNRASLFPHDLDTVMGQGDKPPAPNESIYLAQNTDGCERLFNNPEFMQLYLDKMMELLDTHFTEERMFPLIDEVVTGVASSAQITEMKNFVGNRRNGVLNQIGTSPNALSHGLSVVNGFPTTSDPSYALSGTANAQSVFKVLVNGMPAEWNRRTNAWTTGGDVADWEVAIPFGDSWSYLDDGSDQGEAWRAPDFDDASWASGAAPARLRAARRGDRARLRR